MATIHDVAKLSGYSVSTVSRVLNNHPYVSQEKREKILSVMEDLHYIPNQNARKLSYGKTMNIGVMVPLANLPWFDRMIAGIVEAASNSGYTVTILPSNYDVKVEEKYMQQLLSKAYDGLLILSKSLSSEIVASYAKQAPIVCCENTEGYEIPCVYVDRKDSYRIVMNQLKEQGCDNIGVTLSRSENESSSMRLTLHVYEEVFGEITDKHIFRDCTTYEDGIRAGDYFGRVNPSIQAIFTNGDEVAAGIVHSSLGHAGIRVIGQGNELISQILHFSTLDHHLEQNGEEAFQLLMSGQQKRIMIPNTFIERL